MAAVDTVTAFAPPLPESLRVITKLRGSSSPLEAEEAGGVLLPAELADTAPFSAFVPAVV